MERAYAEDYRSVREDLTEWMNSRDEFQQTVNTRYFNVGEPPAITVGDVMTMIDAGFPSILSQSTWREYTGPMVEELGPQVQHAAELGLHIEASMAAMQPPPAIGVYHESIRRCMKEEVNRMRAILELLETGSTMREIEPDACDNWGTSMQILDSFTQEHMP